MGKIGEVAYEDRIAMRQREERRTWQGKAGEDRVGQGRTKQGQDRVRYSKDAVKMKQRRWEEWW